MDTILWAAKPLRMSQGLKSMTNRLKRERWSDDGTQARRCAVAGRPWEDGDRGVIDA
jgi:hypothetical protein